MNEVDDLLKRENSDDADIEAILDSEFEEEGEPEKEQPHETEAQDIVEEEIDEDEIAEILGGDTGEEPPKKEQPQVQQPKKESVKKKQVPKQPQQQKEKYHEPDKILLYSEPKVGKTHAIASLIEKALNENPDTRFFVIVTDAGFWKTVKRYWRIRKLDEEKLYNQVSYYSVVDINEVFDILRQIRAEARPNDWLIIDVLSDFWDRAQDKFIESCTQDGNVVDLIVEAANDPSRFGTLTGLQWGYCKRVDNTISYYAVINPPCNIIATASAKELGGIEEALGGEEKVEKSIGSMYSSFKVVGYRPEGQKRLSYKFDEIVFLGKDKSGKHYFMIVGSRDIDTDYKRIPYGFSFWETFIGYKRQKMQL